jgi:small subunit ribosomal protein S6
MGRRPEGGANMKTYELALVINGKLEEEAKIETFEKVKGYIERFGGTIVNVDDWGKRRLAYEIQKMRDGFYYFITFESTSEVPAEVEKRIRIMETVLRFLIVNKEA